MFLHTLSLPLYECLLHPVLRARPEHPAHSVSVLTQRVAAKWNGLEQATKEWGLPPAATAATAAAAAADTAHEQIRSIANRNQAATHGVNDQGGHGGR